MNILTCENIDCDHEIHEGEYIDINEARTTWTCPKCKSSNHLPGLHPIEQEGKKDDTGKLDWALLPLYPIREVIKVLMWGEKNYDRDNWLLVANFRLRYYNAAMRHITTWFDGNKKDSTTKLHHLAHAICCLLFLMWFDKKGHNDADKKT